MKNKKVLIGIGILLTIVGVAATLLIVMTLQTGNVTANKNNSDNTNTSTNNKIENNIVNKKEIIKVESSGDGYETYMLDASGVIYACGSSISDTFIKVNVDTQYKIEDIAITDVGPMFKLENGEYYLVSNDIKSDKEINTSLKRGTAKKIMLDNIEQYTKQSITKDNTMKFLTKDGELYELVYNAYTEVASNVRKVMDNVKSVESTTYNVAIIDKDNNGYVYGYNVSKKGILGTSDYAVSFEDKIYISTPVKIGENIKDIAVASRPLMYNLAIYYINTNNELYVMGQSANSNIFMGDLNKFLDKPIKLYDNVKNIHAMMGMVIVETIDGKLIKIETSLPEVKVTQITDNYLSVVLPNGGYGGMFILTKENTLYGYGNNDSGKFGIGDSEFGKQYNITKLKDNVKKVFISNDYNGNKVFVLAIDGKLYGAGNNSKGALGIQNKNNVETFEQIIY